MTRLVLGVSLLLSWSSPPSWALYTVPVAVLLVEKTTLPFSLEILGPVTDMAVERMRREVGIDLERYYGIYPVMCDASLDVGWLSKLYNEHNIRAVIGPTCSAGVESAVQLATFYQLPLVTGVGDLVLDINRFPTFTRLSYSIEKQSMCIKALLQRYQWRHVAILFHATDILLRLQGDSLRLALRQDAKYPIPYDFSYVPSDTTNHREMLKMASRSARVILITTTGDEVRKFMLAAHALGFTDGSYVFITVDLYRTDVLGVFDWRRGDQFDVIAREAFESLFIFTLKVPEGEIWEQFKEEVIMRSSRDYNYTLTDVNYYIGASYDSVIYLALAYNATLERGLVPTEGLTVAQSLWNSTFQGVMGEVYVDEMGDRIADYSVLDLRGNGDYEVVANYLGSRLALVWEPDVEVLWPNDQGPPPDVPLCGFLGNDPACAGPDYTMISIVTVMCILVTLLFVAAISFYVYRRAKFESDLADMGWHLSWNDVILRLGNQAISSKYSMTMENRSATSVGSTSPSTGVPGQVFTTIATYKGALVAVRRRNCTLAMDRHLLLQMKQMRDIQHDNVTRFVGAILEANTTAVVTEYCPKGSLQDILMNESIKLDWTFRYSLMNDIINGLSYIHQSPLKSHGRLTSSNGVVDGRFVLKLTDYGLHSFYYATMKEPDENENKIKRDRLWRAPEWILEAGPASASGDIYSLAVILHEIVSREMPYDSLEVTPTEVVRCVLAEQEPPYRPRLTRDMCDPGLFDLIEACWAQDPAQRPPLLSIKNTMKTISRNKSGSTNLLDNLLQRMEQYAENLEALVEERTQAFQDEKKKSEELLYRVLPKAIAEQLKQGHPVSPEKYECVTIYFSDIVGFTALSAASTPMQVIDLLNDLYSVFDDIIDSFDVYKVETIGDAYMVVSGLPIKNGDNHAAQIARMSLRLLVEVQRFKVRHMPQEQLRLRIGLHSGPCCAGVVGMTMPRYCLFGDTVNTASRMESNGEAMKIHVSPWTKAILDKHQVFDLAYRGEIPMKGKGVVETYWLNGLLENDDGISDTEA